MSFKGINNRQKHLSFMECLFFIYSFLFFFLRLNAYKSIPVYPKNFICSCMRGFWKHFVSSESINNQGPVVQSIVSLTSSLRGQLVKFFATL